MTAPASVRDLTGKTIVVTGANSGIGKETAVALAGAGAHVVILCRNAERGNEALVEVRKRSTGRVDLILADLAEPDSVEQWVSDFRARFDRLDVLVNNAGLYVDERRKNSRGWEMHWAVNHLGPALLTWRLRDLLEAAPGGARIVNVSSFGHRFGALNLDDPFYERRPFIPFRLYADTKLANILWTAATNQRLGGRGVTAYALHPGMIATNLTGQNRGAFALGARLTRPFLLEPTEGASTQVWLASADDIPPSKGHYYAASRPRTPSGAARDPKLVAALADWSFEMLGIEE